MFQEGFLETNIFEKFSVKFTIYSSNSLAFVFVIY